jgi:sigma-E factor negative regulatory protein RseB
MKNWRAKTLLLLLAVAPLSASADNEVQWLDRMNHALNTLNYQGIFIRFRDGDIDPMKVIHRVEDGQATERIVSLDGEGREIITTGDEVVCIFPDTRSIFIEKRSGREPLMGAVPALNADALKHYDLSTKASKRVLNRGVTVIDVSPKDRFRYGYRLWLDDETGLPLISQVRDDSGKIIEQMRFASIEFPEEIPEEAVMSGNDLTGYRRAIEEKQLEDQNFEGEQSWHAAILPDGFTLTVYRMDTRPQAEQRLVQMVYSDGLASVSVFVEKPGPDENPRSGWSKMGAANAYSLLVEDYLVTAVGEVPPITVRDIASSVVAAPRP